MYEFFEMLAIALMAGVIAAAWLPAFILDKGFGIGGHPVVSTIIGSVAGLILLFISPSKLGIAAMIVAAVVSIISSIVQEKILYH
ncbi:MAG: hypothetical protein J5852_00285 [Clostridia bacterium]|nr:hypothetical protein [Clostridia bacterium]